MIRKVEISYTETKIAKQLEWIVYGAIIYSNIISWLLSF